MRYFEFQMTLDGQTVANGHASCAMLSDFQRAFVAGIGWPLNDGGDPRETVEFVGDGYQSTGMLYTAVNAAQKSWDCLSPDGRRYGFWCKRIV